MKKNPEYIKQWDNSVRHGEKAIKIRAYCSENLTNLEDRKHYIWYMAFPKDVIDPFMPIIETSPYFGDQHEFEINGFYLYAVFGWNSNNLSDVIKRLNSSLKFFIGAYKECVDLYRIWGGKLA